MTDWACSRCNPACTEEVSIVIYKGRLINTFRDGVVAFDFFDVFISI